MKTHLNKGILAGIAAVGLASSQAATIFTEDFSNNALLDDVNAASFSAGGWTATQSVQSGDVKGLVTTNLVADALVMTIQPNSNNQGNGVQTLERTLDMSGFQSGTIELTITQTTGGSGWEDADIFEVRADTGGGYQTIFSDPQQLTGANVLEVPDGRIQGTGNSQTISIPLPAASADNGSVGIQFYADMSSNAEQYIIENIAVTADAIPEPATGLLLALGGLSFFLRRRR